MHNISRRSANGTSNTSRHRGFTLIEMMIVVFIIGILAAIAVPSYRQYLVVNAERNVQAKMQQLQLELERWRASALTYKGFLPKNIDSTDKIVYQYDDGNTVVYVPSGSTDANYSYKITLVDGNNPKKSLVAAAGVDNVTGRMWKMLAEKSDTGITKDANNFVLTSQGLRCQNKSAIDIEKSDCGTGQKEW